MKTLSPVALLGMTIALAGAPGRAGTPYTQQMTCPIGGETFAFTTTGSYSTWGSRPDGKPYGSWTFPLDLPECPSNRLIVYKEEFSPAELERLGGLIARPEYRALAGEAQYYRLYWLLREMGEPPLDALWALVRAGWQAETSERRNRYLEEFAAGMARIAGDPSNAAEFAMRGRWINALRELGRFTDASALLVRTSMEPLRQAVDDPQQAEQHEGLLGYYDLLRRLIDRRDARAEPLDAIPPRVAVAHCLEEASMLHEADRAFCASRSEEVERARRMRDR
jgi:hypothetical protein